MDTTARPPLALTDPEPGWSQPVTAPLTGLLDWSTDPLDCTACGWTCEPVTRPLLGDRWGGECAYHHGTLIGAVHACDWHPAGAGPAGAGPAGASATDAAYERWSYGEGVTAGLAAGRRDGWTAGYRAGFHSGAEVAGTRLLLGIEHALRRLVPGRALDLLAGLPHVAGWLDYRRRTAATDDPCPARCGRCSACVRAAAVARNLTRYGQPDFPGPHRPTVRPAAVPAARRRAA